MPWQEPKTDRQPNDYYNAGDLDCVEANIAYLGSLTDVYRYPVELEPCIVGRTIRSIEFAPSLNRIGRNIERLRQALYTPIGWETIRTDWQALRQGFDYQAANALDGNLLRLYGVVQSILAETKHCGTFACGDEVVL